MSDEQTIAREELEAKAESLGVKFHPNLSDEKLRERVNAALEGDSKEPEEDDEATSNEAEETEGQRRVRKQREASELVRIQVTCMNPNKREYDGEVVCAGNRVVGTHKKYVPFDTPWHVPRMIYNVLRDRDCQVFVTERDDKGRQIRKGKLIKEYNVTELPKLTEKELKELAQRQAMASGTA